MGQENITGSRKFELGPDVSANVRALRKFLGSVASELSLTRFAKLLNARHPKRRKLNATTIKRWEAGGEPDIDSMWIMAGLADVTYEQFARGDPEARAKGKSAGPGLTEPYREVPSTAKPKPQAAKKKASAGVATKRAGGAPGRRGR